MKENPKYKGKIRKRQNGIRNKKKKKAVNDQNTKENLSLGIKVTFYVKTVIKLYYIKTRT